MRERRPYLYSDSTVTDAYVLNSSEFSHFLDTLTERNQHKDFENFARKLCEREVCPNLRPQTGPEGGGDGKVDADSYPVAREISDRWFRGQANAGDKKWGVAISAMKRWSEKVRSDVEGMIGTGRSYDQIVFVTSRSARSKDRLRIEKELFDKHGVAVSILDRQWIIDKTISNQYADLAYETMRAGSYDPERLQLGPNDIRRRRELDALEKAISTASTSRREVLKALSDAYDAACVSRELEVPRYETEGRFSRAIRLAENDGTDANVLRARYEYAWTMLWWFDDISVIDGEYEALEELAFKSGLADHASNICNLHQVMIAQINNDWVSPEELNVQCRSRRLEAQLNSISEDRSLPNNALYGAVLLQLHKLTCRDEENAGEVAESVWIELTKIVERASGMGEFPAKMLDGVVEAVSPFVSESETFDALLDKLAEFMGDRQRDGKAGAIYLNRGRQKVENGDPIAAIGWLGRASHHFMKEEYREEQFETLLLLSVAYRAAGLLWVARATCLAALVQINALSEDEGVKRPEIIPTVLQLLRVNLALARIPEFLFSVLWLRVIEAEMTLSEEGTQHLSNSLVEIDQHLSCQLAAAPQSSIRELKCLPDVLVRVHLPIARMILLFRLGYAKSLLDEGSLPNEKALNEIAEMAEMLAAQPAAMDLRKHAINLGGAPLQIQTKVLGVAITLLAKSDQEILIGEALLASLEAFAATALNVRAMPIASRLTLQIDLNSTHDQPFVQFDPENMRVICQWPVGWDIRDISIHGCVSRFLLDFCAAAFPAIAKMGGEDSDFWGTLKAELILDRVVSFSNAVITHNRVFGKGASKLADLSHEGDTSFEEMDAPAPPQSSASSRSGEDCDGGQGAEFPKTFRHDKLGIHSVINSHLWDEAGWRGVFYVSHVEGLPPLMALGFENDEKGRAIFRAWRKEFGEIDQNNAICVSILNGIDQKEPLAYRAHISKNLEHLDGDEKSDRMMIFLARMQTMFPTTRINLESFLEDFARKGSFFIAPAHFDGSVDIKDVKLHMELRVEKEHLEVTDSWKVGPGDQAMMGILPDDEIIVPEGVSNPPSEDVQKLRRTANDIDQSSVS